MGMTEKQLSLVRAIAENKLADAKKFALLCCIEDTTQKNAAEVKRYKNLLQSNPNMVEMPYQIRNDSIIIGATNIPESIDPAVKRRFSVQHEVLPPTKEECIAMMHQYLKSVGMEYSDEEVIKATEKLYGSEKETTQAAILNYMVERIADAVIQKRERIVLT